MVLNALKWKNSCKALCKYFQTVFSANTAHLINSMLLNTVNSVKGNNNNMMMFYCLEGIKGGGKAKMGR